MLVLQGVSYAHPNKEILFGEINFTVNKGDKIALVGNNGTGKSTLLRLVAGELIPTAGAITVAAAPWYVPQHFGQFDGLTVAGFLGVAPQLAAMESILAGDVSEKNFEILDDDWSIEERCKQALNHWGMENIALTAKLETLSGGQKTKVLLAGIDIHGSGLVLLDEPSNHLDAAARNLLHDYVRTTSHTLVIVSHDRKLLHAVDVIAELSSAGIRMYGGNYEFYLAQKAVEQNAQLQTLFDKEKELRKAKQVQREAIERQQKLDARGKRKQEKSGLPTISMNTLRNSAERSTAKMKEVHGGKTSSLADELAQLREQLPGSGKMKLGFDESQLHNGKVLVAADSINHVFGQEKLWSAPVSFEIVSGERIAIAGNNGSGKTTLVRLILGYLEPVEGKLHRVADSSVYIDQNYSLIDGCLTVFEQVQRFNRENLDEHEVKSKLTHFLFTKEYWDKPCSVLSGGERMKLALCCVGLMTTQPDMIILDEPTNNLDLQNVIILTEAINDYKGTLVVISHDEQFVEGIGIGRTICLDG